jgi:hypothetical protein
LFAGDVSSSSKLGLGFEEFPISYFGDPVRPEFQAFPKRFETFRNWPVGLSQNREEMARAGFFYIGMDCEFLVFFKMGI